MGEKVVLPAPLEDLLLSNIILYTCVCVGMWTRGHRWNPTGWTQRHLNPWGGGHSSTWLIVSNRGALKRVRNERLWRLYPACPQFIAKANPTPASKLAFVKRKPGVLLEVQRSSRVSLPAKSAKYAMLRCATKRNAQWCAIKTASSDAPQRDFLVASRVLLSSPQALAAWPSWHSIHFWINRINIKYVYNILYIYIYIYKYIF